MRFVAMKLHTNDQSKEGEKEAQEVPLPKWEPTSDGYLKFLVHSKLVYDTLEKIVDKVEFSEYHTKWVGAFHRKQDFIDVVEEIFRGAMKGKLIVTCPLPPERIPKFQLLYKGV